MIPSGLRLKGISINPSSILLDAFGGRRDDIVGNEGFHASSPMGSDKRTHRLKQSRVLRSLIASRVAFGLAIWTFPGPVGKAFGVDMTRDSLAIYLSRLMGARDVALAWELLVSEGDAQRRWLLACMVCDAADTAAAIAAGRGGLPRRTTIMLLAASLGPMVRGGLALREQ